MGHTHNLEHGTATLYKRVCALHTKGGSKIWQSDEVMRGLGQFPAFVIRDSEKKLAYMCTLAQFVPREKL